MTHTPLRDAPAADGREAGGRGSAAVFRSDMTVEVMRSHAGDSDVTWSARVSTQGEQSMAAAHEDPARSEGLIRYLMKNRHGTPFEHNSFTFLISAPLFVFREFHRHRVGWSYNEESARYREIEPVFYLPGRDRKLTQIGKAGHYTFVDAPPEVYAATVDAIRAACQGSYDAYVAMLEAGVAREVARSVLPVGTYSTMYATCNARSLMAFLSLRTQSADSHFPSYPQREIEMVAEGMEAHFASVMPLTYAAFVASGRVAP